VICAGTLAMPQRRSDPYDQAFAAPERLRAAGLRYCIADQGGGFSATNSRNLPYHAAMAAAFGLPRDEALKSVTLYPAQILGVDKSIGSIEVGKRGDLVVTNGDLLDIATTVERVYIDGEAISMSTRQSRLFEKYNNRPRNPAPEPKPKKK
jgi:imidazolonepropionase-like amidohydrolase